MKYSTANVLRLAATVDRLKGQILVLGLAAALVAAVPASAGNIFLTGHDSDLHSSGVGSAATTQVGAAIAFARGGSTKPVLTFDAGSQLTGALTFLGIPFTNVNPNIAATVTDALFSTSIYSAFAVASDTSCGGCDNSPAGEANIAAHGTAIGAFLNAGGGIVGFAGASSANYYAFVPQTASSVGGAPSSGYSQTAVGATVGIPAVNGDPTHNLFFNPGTNGESAFFQISEVNLTSGNGTILAPAAVSLICSACTVSGGGVITGGGGGTPAGVPEPTSMFLLGSGLTAVTFFARRKRTSNS